MTKINVMSQELNQAFQGCLDKCIESKNEPDKMCCHIARLKKLVIGEMIDLRCHSYEEGYNCGYDKGAKYGN